MQPLLLKDTAQLPTSIPPLRGHPAQQHSVAVLKLVWSRGPRQSEPSASTWRQLLPLRNAASPHFPKCASLESAATAPAAQRSQVSATHRLASGVFLLLLRSPHSLSEVAPGHARPPFPELLCTQVWKPPEAPYKKAPVSLCRAT